MKILEEFKAFAMRGSVIDLAVGVIIGSAFGKIVASLVENVLMPPIGLLIGGIDFTDLKIILRHSVLNSNGVMINPEVAINYGVFMQAVLDFLLIAAAIFLFIKLINKAQKQKVVAPAPAPASVPVPPSEEVVLLTQIRDLLHNQELPKTKE